MWFKSKCVNNYIKYKCIKYTNYKTEMVKIDEKKTNYVAYNYADIINDRLKD